MRESGILMHITSLPGAYGIGTMGKNAYRFVDFLESAGQAYWQILPLTPTGYGDSPYQSFSACAGNHYLIDLDTLVEEGLLKEEEISAVSWGKDPNRVDFGTMYVQRSKVLKIACSRFVPDEGYAAFVRENAAWLEDYAIFMALKEAMGGREAFVSMLDSVFVVPPIYDDSYYGFRIHEIAEMQVANMGNYAHGNQPAQHMIYLYDWAGEPWKTQAWARETMNRLYSAAPDGYCGDEDNGQTSAWYVFSALGFYPVCPGAEEYALGAPLFKNACIHLENGNDVVIKAANKINKDDALNVYISEMELNNKSWNENFLRYNDLLNGATLEFQMDTKPNYNRGALSK